MCIETKLQKTVPIPAEVKQDQLPSVWKAVLGRLAFPTVQLDRCSTQFARLLLCARHELIFLLHLSKYPFHFDERNNF